MPPKTVPTIYIVSDGHGETAKRLVKAAIVQFSKIRHKIVRKSNVLTAEQVEKIVTKAAEAKAVIFYTLVSDDTRAMMSKASAAKLVTTVDLLGPSFTALHDLFKRDRGAKPGLLYTLEHEQIDRMNAIEYTLKHDDGQRPHELSQADVVLVGVSRASKSSTCFYLAYNGIKAANVPLIPEIPPPRQLLDLPPDKVIALRVNVNRLIAIREGRAYNMGIDFDDPYLDKRSIAKEMLATNELIEEHGWHTVEVSYLAIEEIARQIMQLRGISIRTS